jgi:hypothetical protein
MTDATSKSGGFELEILDARPVACMPDPGWAGRHPSGPVVSVPVDAAAPAACA